MKNYRAKKKGAKMNYSSIEEMIEACEKKKQEHEKIAFAIGAGRIAPKIGMRKAQKAAIKEIQNCRGFLGFHPIDIWHTLLIYDTLNNAKMAKNKLTDKGVQLGQIAPILIPKGEGE